MKYFSIDIESSGLDTQRCDILSFGVVFEDTSKRLPFLGIPKFHAVMHHEEIYGEIVALDINAQLIKQLRALRDMKFKGAFPDNLPASIGNDVIEGLCPSIYMHPNQLPGIFGLWAERCLSGAIYDQFDGSKHSTYAKFEGYKNSLVRIVAAGKNYASFDGVMLKNRIDKWSDKIRTGHKIIDPGTLFIDWDNDDKVPGLDKCKERAGIPGLVTHNAVEDAWDVVEVLRTNYPKQFAIEHGFSVNSTPTRPLPPKPVRPPLVCGTQWGPDPTPKRPL